MSRPPVMSDIRSLTRLYSARHRGPDWSEQEHCTDSIGSAEADPGQVETTLPTIQARTGVTIRKT